MSPLAPAPALLLAEQWRDFNDSTGVPDPESASDSEETPLADALLLADTWRDGDGGSGDEFSPMAPALLLADVWPSSNDPADSPISVPARSYGPDDFGFLKMTCLSMIHRMREKIS